VIENADIDGPGLSRVGAAGEPVAAWNFVCHWDTMSPRTLEFLNPAAAVSGEAVLWKN